MALLTPVLAVVAGAADGTRRRAGLRASATETGLVTFTQRHGSTLNPNVQLQILALDGVYAFEGCSVCAGSSTSTCAPKEPLIKSKEVP